VSVLSIEGASALSVCPLLYNECIAHSTTNICEKQCSYTHHRCESDALSEESISIPPVFSARPPSLPALTLVLYCCPPQPHLQTENLLPQSNSSFFVPHNHIVRQRTYCPNPTLHSWHVNNGMLNCITYLSFKNRLPVPITFKARTVMYILGVLLSCQRMTPLPQQ